MRNHAQKGRVCLCDINHKTCFVLSHVSKERRSETASGRSQALLCISRNQAGSKMQRLVPREGLEREEQLALRATFFLTAPFLEHAVAI